ncbi:MAG: alkaline phosphatase [Bacteroidia bacterium]|nr:alkaline phosphatase [Bacteroidia bacterium]
MYYNEHFHTIKTLANSNFSHNPKNLILMIADGVGLGHISAARIANKGKLNLDHCKYIGLMGTRASNEFITDSAAAATAIATGVKTKNGAVGVDPQYKPLPNLREILEQRGLKTGLVACCSITEATPAAFIAHQQERMLHEAIAGDFMDTEIDFFFGNGREHFIDREDGIDLSLRLAAKGYEVLESIEDLPYVNHGKVAGLMTECPGVDRGRGDYLESVTKEAIRILKKGENGFFLMVEGSQIDWAAHDNDTATTVKELLDFDKCLGEVLEFAARDGETLVVVTSDHETGGMTIHDGDEKSGKVEGAFTTVMHTGVMVPVFAFGPQAEQFIGIYENTDLFQRLKKSILQTEKGLVSVS